jgi:hypothetical protein
MKMWSLCFFNITTFACAAACSIGDTYVVIVDVDITRVFAIVDVGGVIIMVSDKKKFQEKSYLRFPECIVDRTIQL